MIEQVMLLVLSVLTIIGEIWIVYAYLLNAKKWKGEAVNQLDEE